MAQGVFTGLVQTQGRLLSRSPRPNGLRLGFAHDFGALDLGESIAVNGVCLTVTAFAPQRFEADASAETVSRSTLPNISVGTTVHLERALKVGERLGGHIVSGHVDSVTNLVQSGRVGDALELVFALPKALAPYLAEKGSVALDGVSLTVNEVTTTSFSVMVVPHTRSATHLGSLRPGEEVNVEVDVLARYVVHLARLGSITQDQSDAERSHRDASLEQALRRAGML